MRRNALRQPGAFALVLVAALVLAACGSTSSNTNTNTNTTPRLIVGAIHVGSIKDAGYNEAEHDGLVYMTQHVQGVKLLEAENVPEAPGVEQTIQTMIGQGATLIFPQSYGYQDYAINVAQKNPSVFFEHPAGYKQASTGNFSTYWGASDSYSYTMGVAAGLMTKNNKLGFISGFAIPQIIDSINAFHLGAQSVNKNVETYVVFNNAWSDPAKEATATNSLIDRGVDVVTGIVDSPITFVKTAESRGAMSIGYHSAAVQSFAPNGWIGGIDFQFGPYFTKVAESVINHTYQAQNYIAPLDSGMVQLAPFGKNVPASVKTEVQNVAGGFLSGAMKTAFVGPIYDQSGKLQIPAGKTAYDVDPNFINDVNWCAQGIVGSCGG